MPMKPGSTKNLLLRLDHDLAERLQTVAEVEGRPVSEVVREAITALLHALVREPPLRHGNQQVALAAMLQFLALNGWDMDPDPPGPVKTVVAAGSPPAGPRLRRHRAPPARAALRGGRRRRHGTG